MRLPTPSLPTISLALAAPLLLPSLGHAKSVNDCGASTFTGTTTDQSPLTAHCQRLAYNIRGGGTWTVEAWLDSAHQIARHRSCAFGVWAMEVQGFFHVGNQDIIDVIATSIERFGAGGYVEANGTMRCQPGGGAKVRWWIYYNERM